MRCSVVFGVTLRLLVLSRYYSTSSNSKTIPDRTIFTIADNRKLYVVYRTVLFSKKNPNPVFKVMLYFDAEYLING